MRPVLAYLDTVSMSPESMERVVMSANDSNAEICSDDDEPEHELLLTVVGRELGVNAIMGAGRRVSVATVVSRGNFMVHLSEFTI